jgi:PAS domain S-box-containing protein
MSKNFEIPVIVNDAEDKICFANAAACKIFNYSEKELQQKYRHELFHAGNTHLYNADHEEESSYCKNLTAIKKNGERFNCDIISTSLADDEGNHFVYSIVSGFYHATKGKPADEKLKESAHHYRFLFENNPFPSWIFDLETLQFLEVNRAATEFYGYSEEEFLSMKLTDLRSREGIALLEEDPEKNKENKNRLHETWKHVKKNGETAYVEVRASNCIYNARKSRLVMINDVTATIKAEASLKKTNEQYRLANERFYFATQATSDIIWDWDLKNGMVEWSENFYKILGHPLPPDSILPASFCINNFHPDDKEMVIGNLNRAINDSRQKKWECDFRYKRGDGSYAYVGDRGYIVRDENGNAIRIIGAMHDLTEQKYHQDLQSLELKIFEISSTPGIPFPEVINNLLKGIEAIHPEMYTSVLLLDNHAIKNLAAPRLSRKYLQMINGLPIGPGKGSCGTAMYRKEAVIVSDIDHDPLWEPYREIAQKFGLKACWSVPIIHSNGAVMGSFAIYYHQPKLPAEKEWNAILKIRNLIRLLMENNNSFEQMKLTNERYDIVTNATHDLIWDWNFETNELYRDPGGLQKVYGFTDNESIKHINNWLDRIHPEDIEKVQTSISDIKNAKQGNIFDVEYRFKKENGNYAYIYDRGYILRNKEGKAYRMIGAAQDITERKKLEQELLDNQKAISQATINTQEKERTEISKELHDNVNQVLTTTKLYLDLAITNPELRDELIIKSSKNIIGAITEIRNLSRSLMIPSLGDLGLVDSIEDLVENINVTKKIDAVFLYEAIDETTLNENQKLTLFRIAQEALNNVIRHAEATHTIIELSGQKNTIQLMVKDDGKGFDSLSTKKGAGLNNIWNRVYLLNGYLTVDTHPGKGCTLVVELPHLI